MALYIIKDLLSDLNSNNINYCHWKSNEHLEASVNGDTDLDVLFDENQKEQVEKILKNNNFHLFEAVWYKKYNGIVDYIGYDYKQGKTVHVHTHFRLDLGEVGIKSYNLPWEKLILDSKVFNSHYNIYTSSASIEYILLVVRTAFKRDTINYRSNRRVVSDFNKEAKWLYPQVSVEELSNLSRTILDDKMALLIEKIRIGERYDKQHFVNLKKLLKIYFAPHRVVKASQVTYLKFLHLFNSVKRRALGAFGIRNRPKRRSLVGKGLIVSLMGPDGAGKSTQTKLVTDELAKKVDVLFMYMGSGKGNKSFQRKIIDSLFDFGLNYRNKTPASSKPSRPKSSGKEKVLADKGKMTQFVLSIKAISLGYERKRRLLRIEKEKNQGTIVICDRYPQTFSPGHNDGMRLNSNINSSNILLKAMANYENSCYQLANKIAPDIVIKMTGQLDTLYARRPEMTLEDLEKKQNGIVALKFNKQTDILTLEIDKPIEEIKTIILNAISNQIAKKD